MIATSVHATVATPSIQDIIDHWHNSTVLFADYINDATNSTILGNQIAFKTETYDAIGVIGAQLSFNIQLNMLFIDSDNQTQQIIEKQLNDVKGFLNNITALPAVNLAQLESDVTENILPIMTIMCGSILADMAKLWNDAGVDTRPVGLAACPFNPASDTFPPVE